MRVIERPSEDDCRPSGPDTWKRAGTTRRWTSPRGRAHRHREQRPPSSSRTVSAVAELRSLDRSDAARGSAGRGADDLAAAAQPETAQLAALAVCSRSRRADAHEPCATIAAAVASRRTAGGSGQANTRETPGTERHDAGLLEGASPRACRPDSRPLIDTMPAISEVEPSTH